MALSRGTLVGRYEILGPLGEGGMGQVYRAHDTRLDRDVALKVLQGEWASDAEQLGRFEQEARATAALNHPRILSIFDIGTYESAPYIVTELLHGATLGERLQMGALEPIKAIDFAIQIAEGLHAAHERGILHRDLKPDNVLIGSD